MLYEKEFEKFVSIHRVITALNYRERDFYSWMSQNFDLFFSGKLLLHYVDGEYHPDIENYPKGPIVLDDDTSEENRISSNELRFLMPINDSVFHDAMKNSEYRLFLKESQEIEKNSPKSDFLDDVNSPLFPLTISKLWVDIDTAREVVKELRILLSITERKLTIQGEDIELTPTQTLYLWALYELKSEKDTPFKTQMMYKKCGELQDEYQIELVSKNQFDSGGKPEHPSRIFKDNLKLNDDDRWIEVTDDQKGSGKLVKLKLGVTNITLPDKRR